MSQSLSIKTDEVLTALAAVLGVDRTYANWDDTLESDARQIIRDGLRRFYHPPPLEGAAHQWRWLEKLLVVNADAAYETGTIAVASGTVTGDGTTFPSWAADGYIRADGHVLFVTARDSGTELTVENDAVSIDAGTSFTLYRWRKALPTDFGEFLGRVTYNHPNYPRQLMGATEQEIRQRLVTQNNTGQTRMYAIVPPEQAIDATIGTARGYLAWWPTMDAEASITGTYRAEPEDRLDNTNVRTGATTVVQVDSVHAGTVKAAILAAAEEYLGINGGRWEQRFLERLAASIKPDYQFSGPIGFPADESKSDRFRRLYLDHVPTLDEV